MSGVGTFEGYKVTASGRIASQVSFPRADYDLNVAALPQGWRLVGGKRADPDAQYFVDDRLVTRPVVLDREEIAIAVGEVISFEVPAGTEVIRVRGKELIEPVSGRISLVGREVGVQRYSIVPPSPYRRQIIVVTVINRVDEGETNG